MYIYNVTMYLFLFQKERNISRSNITQSFIYYITNNIRTNAYIKIYMAAEIKMAINQSSRIFFKVIPLKIMQSVR